MFKGYVHVYTGNGKGKTTAAIGLAIRALGAGKRVCFLQFMKSLDYSEQKILAAISPNLLLATIGKPFFVIKEGGMPAEELAKWREEAVVFPPGNPPQEYVDLINQGLQQAKAAVSSGEFDLVILDELIVAMHFELVTWEQIKEIIEARSENVELVLTGRGAIPELIEQADLVTEMKEVKHYYQQGVMYRKGIEN
ncbi:cob(I)yrinic acid a,c-diamide adenosyltransferase [Sporomusa sphaeroides DSM 2875]|uniref:cob(I)yrinic acid a,c-diamide adenosyltransferase n=1 Tax=Sporomusa sphaeroides TaxID=47679 RepID=UPI002030FA38|nr:cob(I)yrinic acid a,c-diamide adenosyltransferase [Sporomusa sphaeroides]MCM0759494.1 cob(I)yrinic acid a,c-diamide adenosyltransferase [Sporomusa sphaeroides DSM 2875]